MKVGFLTQNSSFVLLLGSIVDGKSTSMKRELRCKTETVPAAVTPYQCSHWYNFGPLKPLLKNGKAPKVEKSEDLPNNTHCTLSGIRARRGYRAVHLPNSLYNISCACADAKQCLLCAPYRC